MRAKRKVQTSDSLFVGVMLALAGGFMDAYSYTCRGGVFANAETGNIVLLAINASLFKWTKAFHYFLPILAFAFGVIISEAIKKRKDRISALHWRQITIGIETVALSLTAFLPQSANLAVNIIISMTCGIQVSSFEKFHNHSMATTMCTGNLKTGTRLIHEYKRTGDRNLLTEGLLYYGCIVCFMIGVVMGSQLTGIFNEYAILAASAELLVVLLAMFFEERAE
jgi:uncharacterized membrane protein YoaK (UPF0700 family)